MEWSFEGALLRVEKGENNATKFTYDASGNRIQALTRDGAKMSAANYLVDENTAYAQVLEERDSSGELQARYVYGQGYGPLWMHRVQKNGAGATEVRDRYLLADGHGSVRQLVTASGTVTDSYFYDAWGGALSGGSGNTVNPYRYNGQQTDEATGGYYLRARYYQPGNGRFLGHDPLLGNNSDPVSLHRYLYAGGDGINYVDASGKKFNIVGVLTASAITATLMSVVFTGSKMYGQSGAEVLSSTNTSVTKEFGRFNQALTMIRSHSFSIPELGTINSSANGQFFVAPWPWSMTNQQRGEAYASFKITPLLIQGRRGQIFLNKYLFQWTPEEASKTSLRGNVLRAQLPEDNPENNWGKLLLLSGTMVPESHHSMSGSNNEGSAYKAEIAYVRNVYDSIGASESWKKDWIMKHYVNTYLDSAASTYPDYPEIREELSKKFP